MINQWLIIDCHWLSLIINDYQWLINDNQWQLSMINQWLIIDWSLIKYLKKVFIVAHMGKYPKNMDIDISHNMKKSIKLVK